QHHRFTNVKDKSAILEHYLSIYLSIYLSLSLFQVSVWKNLFGKEADKQEQKEPVINAFISVPKENSALNCAALTAGILEAILTHSGFQVLFVAHWHKGTMLMIKFDEAVIARDKQLNGK
uniref:Trafficking protein particle complex 5 n=1 Tax=Sinocyclocheilus anshuiensis TaxID=1608454 RepID=A0A671RIP5_9TELE